MTEKKRHPAQPPRARKPRKPAISTDAGAMPDMDVRVIPNFDSEAAAEEFCRMLDEDDGLDTPQPASRFWPFLLGSILLIAGLLWVSGAFAHPLNAAECTGRAQDALRMAIHRDAGDSIALAQKAAQEAIAPIFGQPDSYLQDDQDRQEFFAMVADIWAHPDAKPGAIFDTTYEICTGHPDPQLLERSIPVVPSKSGA